MHKKTKINKTNEFVVKNYNLVTNPLFLLIFKKYVNIHHIVKKHKMYVLPSTIDQLQLILFIGPILGCINESLTLSLIILMGSTIGYIVVILFIKRDF